MTVLYAVPDTTITRDVSVYVDASNETPLDVSTFIIELSIKDEPNGEPVTDLDTVVTATDAENGKLRFFITVDAEYGFHVYYGRLLVREMDDDRVSIVDEFKLITGKV